MYFKKTALAASLLQLSYALPTNSTGHQPCADIAMQAKKNITIVPASDALACLRSVPFNATAATKLVQQFNESTLVFQSNTAYIKDPPRSYQQPAADLFGILKDIDRKVHSGGYSNQYDFEADIQSIIQKSHDGHFAFTTGTISQFLFTTPLNIVSISKDGHQLPEVYDTADLLREMSSSGKNSSVSPIKSIDGKDAVAYLREFAAKFQFGGLEPHADYQALMSNAAASVGGYPNTWLESLLFTVDSVDVVFQNGTRRNFPFVAEIQDPADFASISSGQDFYDLFVSTQSPLLASSSASATSQASQTATATASASATASLTAWDFGAYPIPFIAQPGLGIPQDGFGTGYMIEEASLGVLSLPSFDFATPDSSKTFSKFVQDFIAQTKAAGIKHVLIDLQGNGGGTIGDNADIFKHFFPKLFPYEGWRIRLHDSAEALGSFYSDYFAQAQKSSNSSLVDLEIEDFGSTWVAQLNNNSQTGQTYKSWNEIADGYQDHGDLFTKTTIDYWANALLDLVEIGVVVDGFANRTNTSAVQPYSAQDIVILTDSRCASTCTLAVEAFSHIAGVRTVVAGGLPETGPMQITGGVRGHEVYGLAEGLETDVQTAVEVQPDLAERLPDFDFGGVQVSTASFNFKDQLRENETAPLQFAYVPADCRIFYTPDTFNNYTALWMYAADAIWGDGSKCVKGSTGLASNKTTSTGPPNMGGARYF